MKSDEKLIEKFITDKMRITVDDCDRLLKANGYRLHKTGGSHLSYHKKGDTPINIVIPKHTKYLKPGYIDKLVKRLNLEG